MDNIEADTTDLGIFVADSGAATVGGVSAALTGLRVQTTGDLSFTTNGTMSLDDTDGLAMVQGAGNAGTGGDITLTSIGAAADITAVADRDAVTAPAGSISLVAGRDITLGSGPLTTTTSARYWASRSPRRATSASKGSPMSRRTTSP